MSDNANGPVSSGARLKELRQAAELSQERLAQLAGCSTSTVRLAERGWRPSPAMCARLAAALVPPSTDFEATGTADAGTPIKREGQGS
jgi:transcriptional regulator with XRE-family HTH domain